MSKMAEVSPRALHLASRLLRVGPIPSRVVSWALRRDRLGGRFGDPDAVAAVPPARGLSQEPLAWRTPDLPSADTNSLLGGELFVVKDNMDAEGAPTGQGMVGSAAPAARDSEVVRRLKAAGGRLLGKAHMTELGVGGLGVQPFLGTLDNPAAPGHLPGGSSCGTAVSVASGLARFGLGSDGLGSVRIPAAWCGLVGLKSGFGVVPMDGYGCVSPSLDGIGPLARTAADAALLWEALTGQERPREGRAPARVGRIRELEGVPVARQVASIFESALSRLGAPVETVSVPGADHGTAWAAASAAWELWNTAWARPARPAPETVISLALGRAIDRATYDALQERRARLREATLRALDRVDVLAMPTTPIPPPAPTPGLLAGAVDVGLMSLVGAFTPLANATGLPAITVPAGRDDRGRPVGAMFVGRPGSERDLLALALALEAALQS